MILYHGSNVEVRQPHIIEQTRGLDFGAGFYTTSSREQSVKFSRNIVDRRGAGVPTVSVYEFDEKTAAKELRALRFKKANAQWLDLVKDNRLKIYSGVQYDLIIGPVANDDVMPSIQAYLSGQFTLEAALIALKTKKLVDQYCLKSEHAVSLLRFQESFRAEA
ncbi:hypothetical protein AGMMS50276_21270 [Synergistales bacterium]|nr:hypothetical protein AGMMS50276_21270 [Synergistales bacterium]